MADSQARGDVVTIYSDGGADPNPGIGGWAALLLFGDQEKVLTGNEARTTNNRMELSAAIHALRELPGNSRVEFHTDSQYLRRGITDGVEKWAAAGWRTKNGRPIPNADLWQELEVLVAPHTIDWHWVQGHSGDPLNERVDRLAREARLAITPRVDLAAGVPRLYVRGSCVGNPGPGSWAAVLESDGEWKSRTGSERSTTNNRMEITAAIEGVTLVPPGSRVQIFTTSDYLFQGITQWVAGWRARGWRKKDGQAVANADLWQALTDVSSRYQVEWVNGKGRHYEGFERAGRLLNRV